MTKIMGSMPITKFNKPQEIKKESTTGTNNLFSAMENLAATAKVNIAGVMAQLLASAMKTLSASGQANLAKNMLSSFALNLRKLKKDNKAFKKGCKAILELPKELRAAFFEEMQKISDNCSKNLSEEQLDIANNYYAKSGNLTNEEEQEFYAAFDNQESRGLLYLYLSRLSASGISKQDLAMVESEDQSKALHGKPVPC